MKINFTWTLRQTLYSGLTLSPANGQNVRPQMRTQCNHIPMAADLSTSAQIFWRQALENDLHQLIRYCTQHHNTSITLSSAVHRITTPPSHRPVLYTGSQHLHHIVRYCTQHHNTSITLSSAVHRITTPPSHRPVLYTGSQHLHQKTLK